mmetsp:Transcript_37161/g.100423  ORF Transcript_37161/g.100423 Transcript_37161/m.100423 type:complete len:81 (-) Transcript_37161:1006-1248(-)
MQSQTSVVRKAPQPLEKTRFNTDTVVSTKWMTHGNLILGGIGCGGVVHEGAILTSDELDWAPPHKEPINALVITCILGSR